MSLERFLEKENVQPSIEKKTQVGFVDDWLNKNFRVEKTKRDYVLAIQLFVKAIYGNDATDYNGFISRYFKEQRNFLEDLKTFIQYMNREGYAPRSIHTLTIVIKKFFSRHGHKISDDDWEDISRGLLPPNVAATQDEILTKDQCKMLLPHFSVLGKAIFLFLLNTGARIGETLKLRVDDFNLETDPPSVYIRPQYTKGGVGGRVMWFSYEAKEALIEWWKVKDTKKKRGRAGKFPKEMAFGIKPIGFNLMLNMALRKAGLAKRDPSTKTKFYIYHVHTLRKFFSTAMSEAGVPESIIHAWMGHKGYLDSAYKRYTKEKLAQIYKEHMDAVTIQGGVSKHILEELKMLRQKNEEIETLKKLCEEKGIKNGRPLVEMFKDLALVLAKELSEVSKPIQPQPIKPIPQETSQPTKSEAVRPTQVVENVPIPEKPKELEKPKVDSTPKTYTQLIKEGKCLRQLDLKDAKQWEIACHWCFNNYRYTYDQCRATVKVQVAEKTI
ncbi:MAG: site-specific integrase [Candidatus Bathyarchaeia archaeon]